MTSVAVSVVTIFRDAVDYLVEAIDSVRDQSFPDWELILVDDGSSDGSGELARSAADSHPERIRYLAHPGGHNLGMSASRNLGLRAAVADLVCFLDADDVYLPERIGHHLELLTLHPRAGMVYGPRTLWRSWASDADQIYPTFQPTHVLIEPPGLFVDYLLGDAPTPATCSFTVRRSVALDAGGFEERFRGMFEDQAFLMKVVLRSPVLVTDRPLDLYRQHETSASAVAAAEGAYDPGTRSNEARARFDTWLHEYLAGPVPHARTCRRAHRRQRRRTRIEQVPYISSVYARLVRRELRRRRTRRLGDPSGAP